MIMRDREIAKVKKTSIKRMEPILYEIDEYERSFIDSFNINIENIFVPDKFPDMFALIIEELDKTPNKEKINTREVTVEVAELDENKKLKIDENGNIIKTTKTYTIPANILQDFHKSYIKDPKLRKYFEDHLTSWFDAMTNHLKPLVSNTNSIIELMEYRSSAFALASLAITAFHNKPHMVLRDNQKMAGIAMSEGDVAELASGEGKTLAIVLPTYLHALREKGANITTANNYLAKRDYAEMSQIFNGLGLTCGYAPENVEELCLMAGVDIDNLQASDLFELDILLREEKRKAYRADVTYLSKNTDAFDYLNDGKALSKTDLVQRPETIGFKVLDEADDILIDEARTPYIISTRTKVYEKNMTLKQLCHMFYVKEDEISNKTGIKVSDKLSYEKARYIAVTFFGEELLEDPYDYQRSAEEFLSNSKNYLSKIYTLEGNSYGYQRADDLYDAIIDDRKYIYVENDGTRHKKSIAEDIMESGFGVVYCKEKNKIHIFYECIDDFIKYCYKRGPIFAQIENYKKEIMADPNYSSQTDYYIDEAGRLRLQDHENNPVIERILNDPNYPKIVSDYQKYLNNERSDSALFLKYLMVAIRAHCQLEKGKDYIVQDGKVKVLKNGRIQERSTLSGGLQTAVELKEGIVSYKRTKEVISDASITQKDLHSKCDVLACTTGTSEKDIFGKIYGKGTVEIPRNAYYNYYGGRRTGEIPEPLELSLEEAEKTYSLIFKTQESETERRAIITSTDMNEVEKLARMLTNGNKQFDISLEDNKIKVTVYAKAEPLEVKIDKTEFTTTVEEKINLIYQSIVEAQRYDPQKPILIVVANPMEIDLLKDCLTKRSRPFRTLTALTPKEDEAEIIAHAGEPGAITITTEMAGRGTDIKVGGDRDTIIDIYVSRKFLEENRKGNKSIDSISIREEVEKELIKLGKITTLQEENENRRRLANYGLTIISSGVHSSSRVDKQNEGRVGRNGETGRIKRFICSNDLSRIGIVSLNGKDSVETCLSAFEKTPEGRLIIDVKKYNEYMDVIGHAQQLHDLEIMNTIRESQKLNSVSSKLQDKYRDQRNKILCDDVGSMEMVEDMISQTTDAIISSYIKTNSVSKKYLTTAINKMPEGEIDIEAISLEVKQTLGVSFDFVNAVSKTNISIVELRSYIVKSAILRFQGLEKLYEENKNKNEIELSDKVAILQNDYMSHSLPEILEDCSLKKWTTAISLGLGEQAGAMAEIEFDQSRRFLTLESYRCALSAIMGVELTSSEFKSLEDKRYSSQFKSEEELIKEEIHNTNKLNIIDRVRKIKDDIERKDAAKKRQIARKIYEYELSGKEYSFDEICRKVKLYVRPFTIIGTSIKPCKFTRKMLEGEIKSIVEEKKHVKRAA